MTCTRSRTTALDRGLNSLQTRLAHRAGNVGRSDLWKSWIGFSVLRLGVFWLALVLVACGRCGDQRVVSGELAYTRCRTLDLPSAEQKVGPLTFRMRQRTLVISGLKRPARLAAFAGPGPGGAPSSAVMAALMADKPALLLVLGDAGDSATVAAATLRALAATGIPSVLVAGARDDPARLQPAV